VKKGRQGERINQKRRTRSALVQAAKKLIDDGMTPTVAQVADAALVSRATAYRYFPAQDALLAEAGLSTLADPQIEASLRQVAESTDDPEQRIHALINAIHDAVTDHDPAFRRMLRHSLDARELPNPGDPAAPNRGARRIDWIHTSLQSISGELPPAAADRLVAALSLCMGIEAHLVLHDICDLDPEAAKDIARWAASAILHEATERHPRRST
jgi:AcrR family transcriptional regulator